MRIRNALSLKPDEETIHEIESDSIHILADDGQPLFSIAIENNKLQVVAGEHCIHEGMAFDSTFYILPVASNVITVVKMPSTRGNAQ